MELSSFLGFYLEPPSVDLYLSHEVVAKYSKHPLLMPGWKSRIPEALAFDYNLFVKLSPKAVLVSCYQTLSLVQDHQTQQFVSFVIPKSSHQGPARGLSSAGTHSPTPTRVFSFALQPWKVHCCISTREVPISTLYNSPFTGVHLLPRQTALFSFHFQLICMNLKMQSFGFYKCPILRYLWHQATYSFTGWWMMIIKTL